MSTQGRQPRQPRQVKPKPAVNNPAPVETAQPVANTQEQPTQQAAEQVAVVPEQVVVPEKIRKTINCGISAARVRRHLDKINVNAKLEAESKPLKTKINSYDHAKTLLEKKTVVTTEVVETDGKKKTVHGVRPATEEELAEAANTIKELEPELAECRTKLTALTRERIRIAGDSSLVLSTVSERLVVQLAMHAIDRAIASKKKIIMVSHLHEDGVSKLPLFPLIEPLPTFRKHADRLAKLASDSAAKEHDTALLIQARKDFKREFALQIKNGAKSNQVAKPAETTQVQTHADAEDDNEQDSKTSFKFYVSTVCSNLTKRDDLPQYHGIRFSTDLKGYLSDLLIELIHRLSGLVLLTAGSMKNKTIGNVAIMRTIESLMTDGHKPVEVIEYKMGDIRDPAVIEAENTKRKESEKAGLKHENMPVSKIPLVSGLVAVRTVSYPTSGYDAIFSEVKDKLALYASLSADAKKAVDGSKDKDATVEAQ